MDPEELKGLGLGSVALTPSRANGLLNMLEYMKKRARACCGALPSFPSLLITADGLIPQGPFAEAQAQYLKPNAAQVDNLVQVSLSQEPMEMALKDMHAMQRTPCSILLVLYYFHQHAVAPLLTARWHCLFLLCILWGVHVEAVS